MRSYHIMAMLTVILFLIMTMGEGSSFTVRRPQAPAKKKPIPGETQRTQTPSTPTVTKSNNYGGPGINPAETTTAPPASPALTPSPSPSPSPAPRKPRNGLPLLLTFVFLVIAGLVGWYYTRNINFKRLFK